MRDLSLFFLMLISINVAAAENIVQYSINESNLLSRPALEETKIEQLTGVIIQKKWAKSHQSYCAGGSDYFVLQYGDEQQIILQYQPSEGQPTLADFIKQTVIITGYKQLKTVTPTDRGNDGQHIVQTLSHPTLCSQLIVTNVMALN